MVEVKPVQASVVAAFLDTPLVGDDLLIERISPIDHLAQGSLAFLQRDRDELIEAANGVGRVFVLAARSCEGRLTCPHVLVADPRLAYARVLTRFFEEFPPAVIADSARIDPAVRLGQRVGVGHGTVIDADVEIGDDTRIGDHVVIRNNTRIGRNCIILSHVVIGESGFGFDFDRKTPVRIPHMGGVRIGDHVQINCRASIDRGTLDHTYIEDHVKIATQVRIAHNCRVGEGTLVAGGTSLCGSVRVGRHCWIGAGALVRDGGITIGDDAQVGMGAVVVKPVNPREVVTGNPASVLRMRGVAEEF